jgi:hypothetical protein
MIREQVRRGSSFFRCVLDGTETSKAVELPTWMFNRTACWAQDLSSMPYVSAQALRDLRELLCHASVSVESQYPSFVTQGDTDATDSNQSTATATLSTSSKNAQVGTVNSRRTTKGDLQAGSDASTVSCQQHSRREGDRP